MTKSDAEPAAETNSRPVRILCVHHVADLYGASRCLARLLAYLDRKKFEPVVVLAEEGPLKPMLEKIGIEVVIHPEMSVITRPIFRSWRVLEFAWRFPWSVLFFRRLIREKNIALVHTNTGIIVSPALAAWLARVPHIWHIRDWFGEFKPVWMFYSRYILWLSAKVLNVSHPIALQFDSVPKNIVVHDGFTLAEFPLDRTLLRSAFRNHFQLGNGLVVGCVGRIKFFRKGQDDLVRAAAILKQRGVRAKYLFVGAPFRTNMQHLVRLKELVQSLGLEKDVIFTGELNDVRGAYAAMDVCVLPSAQPEPFGGVVLEAMAMERAVVATSVGGSLDQVVDGVTGFLVPPSNPEALADKLQLLLADPGLREKMGVAGRERVRTEFPVDRMVRETEAVYQELIP